MEPFHQVKVLKGIESDAAAKVAVSTFQLNPAIFTAVVLQPQPEPQPPGPAVPAIKDLALLQPATNLRFVDPDLARQISRIPVAVRGVPRERITVPVSPSAEVTDTLLFEEPADPNRKLYLPRYRLTVRQVSGREQYHLSLETGGAGARLTVHLERYPAPEVQAAAAAGAQEVPHSVAVLLRHALNVGGAGGGQAELVFQEVAAVEGGLRAVLTVGSLREVDRLYYALSDPAYGAALIVRRAAQVAVPVPAGSRPVVAGFADVTAFDRIDPAVLGRPVRPRPVFGEKLDPVGPLPTGEEPSVPLYRATTRTVDDAVQPSPFAFARELHPYVFGSLIPGESSGLGLVRYQVGSQVYWQDGARPHSFFYLPDRFKIARRPESPHNPILSVRFETGGGALEEVQGTLEYVALPYTDPRRLAAAAEALRGRISGPLPAGVDGPVFEPLLAEADKVKLRVSLPRAGAGGAELAERAEALVSLHGARDAVTLPLAQFQTLFDALFGGSSLLLQGEVVVETGEGTSETIPFTARMDDLVGEVFDAQEEFDPEAGGLRVILRNAIESPLRVSHLGADLRNGEALIPSQVVLGGALPVELRPGEELRLRVNATAPLAGTETLHAELDLSGVEVLPDREAVWAAVLDPSTTPEYVRRIQVRTFAQIFQAPPDRPEDQIMALVLDFERSESVVLDADHLQVEAALRLPLADYVLRRVDSGAYRYRVTVVRLSGQTQDPDWRTASTGILFPDVRR